MKRVIAVLTAAAIVFAGCSFCLPQKQFCGLRFFPAVTGMFPRQTVMSCLDGAIAAFEKSHPDVEIEYISGIPDRFL